MEGQVFHFGFRVAAALVCLILCTVPHTIEGRIFFNEPFNNMDNWVHSRAKDDYGKFELSTGAFYGDPAISLGLKTAQSVKFYASSAPIPEPMDNHNTPLVVSMSVKHEQGLDCGGGYIKVLSDMDPEEFSGDSEYQLMFGPDKCGPKSRVHIIFRYKGKNILWNRSPTYPDDKFTHVYTLAVYPNNSFAFYLDMHLEEEGQLDEQWSFLPDKRIPDPKEEKPEDWVDNVEIDDPEDKKPDDWDKEPAEFRDPEAKQPEDWDAEEDGLWEAPMIPNPKAKGKWSPKRIPNPKYKGPWEHPLIDNPEYTYDPDMYRMKPLKYVGIDVWQVKSGSIFDNIIVADDLAEVNAVVEQTWLAVKGLEKAAKPPDASDTLSKGEDEEGQGMPPDDMDDDDEGAEAYDDAEDEIPDDVKATEGDDL